MHTSHKMKASSDQRSATTTTVLRVDKSWNSGFFEDNHYTQLSVDLLAVAIKMRRELAEVKISGLAEETEL